MEYSTFLATVKEKAAERMSGGANIFDLTDAETLSYASSLVARVTESAGCKIEELFALTAEDFCQHISEPPFKDVAESGSEKLDDDLASLGAQLSEDAVSLFGLFSDYGDDRARLVDAITKVQESAAKAAEEKSEEAAEEAPEGSEEKVEEAAEAPEGAEEEAAEETAEGTEEKVEEAAEAPEGEEEAAEEKPEGAEEKVEESAEEKPEGEEAAEEKPEGAEEKVAEGAEETVAEGEEEASEEKPEGAEEKVAEGAEGAEEGSEADGESSTDENAIAINIIPASERVHEGAWGEVDKGALKSRLRGIKEAGGEGIDAVIQDTYAVVGSLEDSSSWKYPHHVLEGADLILSPAGVATAAGYLQGGRFSGTDEQKQFASEHLGRHYGDMEQEVPEGLSAVTESTVGARMISLEIVGENENEIISFEEFAQKEGFSLAVAEAAVNALHSSGMVAGIEGPTLVAISRDQLSAITQGMETISAVLMGKTDPGKQVAESAVNTDELTDKISAQEATIGELNDSLNLSTAKKDALLVLIEGSALEGIGESIMKADSVEKVSALKTVSETPGLKRLITANIQVSKEGDETSVESVAEAGGAKSLERLSKVFETEEEAPETSKSQKKGGWAGQFV